MPRAAREIAVSPGWAPCAPPPTEGSIKCPGGHSHLGASSAFPPSASKGAFVFVASPTLASRKDADNANSDPTASAHGVTAATGWHTPESRLNASGSAPAGEQLRRPLQENAFLHHFTGLIVRALGRRVRKRHFRKNAATCGGAEAWVSEGHCGRDREWFREPLGRDRCQRIRAGLLAISEIRILNRLYSAGLPVTVSFLRSALEGRERQAGTIDFRNLAWQSLAAKLGSPR